MLTIDDVTRLYQDGVEVKLRRKSHPQKLKGDYDPSRLVISIFLSEIVAECEFGLTLLHEFIHARDDHNGHLEGSTDNDKAVEAEARQTYRENPYVLELIKELYQLGVLADYKNRPRRAKG